MSRPDQQPVTETAAAPAGAAPAARVYPQAEVDSMMANLRRTMKARIDELESQLSAPASAAASAPASPPAAPAADAGAVPDWAKPLIELAKSLPAAVAAAPTPTPPAPAPAATPPPPAATGPVTLAAALAELKGGTAATPLHLPNPVPLGDLDRSNLPPNRLTSDMVQRLGADGTYRYVKEWFARHRS